jgi:hypothetical protein
MSTNEPAKIMNTPSPNHCYFVSQNVEEDASLESLAASAYVLREAAAFKIPAAGVYVLSGTSENVTPVLIPKKYGNSLKEEVDKIFGNLGLDNLWYSGMSRSEERLDLAYIFVVKSTAKALAQGRTPEALWREGFLDLSAELDDSIIVVGWNPIVGDYAWQRYDTGDLGTGVVMADSNDEEDGDYVGTTQLAAFGVPEALLDPSRYN